MHAPTLRLLNIIYFSYRLTIFLEITSSQGYTIQHLVHKEESGHTDGRNDGPQTRRLQLMQTWHGDAACGLAITSTLNIAGRCFSCIGSEPGVRWWTYHFIQHQAYGTSQPTMSKLVIVRHFRIGPDEVGYELLSVIFLPQ